jgi:hypothetical protein
MKTLLCLLSQQHVPNLLAVHHFQPERLVLVETAGMRRKNAARDFREALRLGGRAYDDQHCQSLPLDDENNPGALGGCLQAAAAALSDAEWTVNLTGGTKPMSIGAYEFFRDKPARLVYTSVDRPNRFLDIRGGAAEDCAYRPGVPEFLAGYGFSFSLPKVEEKEKYVRFLPPTAQLIARRSPRVPLLRLMPSANQKDRAHWEETCKSWREKARMKGVELQSRDVDVEIPDAEVREALARAFRLGVAGTFLTGWLNRQAADFLTGGWLEVFMWDLMKRHADALGLWDVRLGPVISHRDKGVMNEIDVVFMRDCGLCSIECKSGAQGHDPGGDILYKIETVKHQFGALLGKAFLATTAENILHKDREGKRIVKPELGRRADLYGCRIVACEEIRRLAECPDDPELVRQVFFAKGE